MLVQAFVTTLAIETFDKSVLDGFAWPDELQLYATPMRPFVDDAAAEFRAIV